MRKPLDQSGLWIDQAAVQQTADLKIACSINNSNTFFNANDFYQHLLSI